MSDNVHKKSQSQDRTAIKPNLNQQMQEFHKIFTPYKSRKSSKDNSQRYINVQYKELSFKNKAQTTAHRQEYSPNNIVKGSF